MPEKILSAAFVKTAPPGKHADGAGLWAYVREPGNGFWVLRFHVHGKRREAGLGSLKSVSLAEARAKAAAARAQIASGVDPIRAAYAHAVEQRYRFFSYGDAMLLTRAQPGP